MEINMRNGDLQFGGPDIITSPLWRKTTDAKDLRVDTNLLVTTGNDTPLNLQQRILSSQWKRTNNNNFHKTTNSIWGRRLYTSEGERRELKPQEAVK
jgi:hypothetical protein